MTGKDFYPQRTKFLEAIQPIIPGRVVGEQLDPKYFDEVWKIAVASGLQMPNELWVTLGTIGFDADATPFKIKHITKKPGPPPENSKAKPVTGYSRPRILHVSTKRNSDNEPLS